MPSEHALVPYQAADAIAARAVLVLAPHPDDEVFGCGGAIAQHVATGCAVHVVVLTDGAVGGDAATRADECRQAAQVLGHGEPEFWNLPDRGLVASAELAQRLAQCITSRDIDLVYAPSPYEVHPDHRQTTALLCAAANLLERPLRVAFYEVGSPLPQPNLLLDITPWHERKRAAALCFGSQLAAQDYAEQIEGLGRYRTYTLPREVRAAEAFCVVDSADLARGAGFELALAEAGTWERLHDPAAAAGAPTRPRVTVVMRSVGRPLLHEALDSVARQTWTDIEVLVVAAVAGHPALPPRCGPHPLRLVGTGEPLARSRAANVGLAHATGEYLLLLDDDDWLLPSHLARLVGALHGQKLWRAAYTGIVLVDAANQPIGQTFDWPFDPMRQRAGNLTPIHAVLFHRSLLDEGCRFDEALDRYEDWDFWLQVAARTAMAHVPGASAAYRIHASSGVHEDAGAASASSLAIHAKWEASWSGRQKQEIMSRVWAYDEQAAELAHKSQALLASEEERRREAAERQQEAARHEQVTSSLREQARALQAQGDALRAELQAMRESRDALQIELQAMRQDRDALQTELQAVRQDRDALQIELGAVRDSRDALQIEFGTMRDSRDALQLELRAMREGRDALSIELQAMHQSRQALQLEIQAVRESHSWRLTNPLRRAGTLARTVRHALRPAGLAAVRQVYAGGGLRAVTARVRHRLAASATVGIGHAEWVRRFDTPGPEQFAHWRTAAEALPLRPLISVVMPVFNPSLAQLREAIASVRAQVYPHWELCIADDASTDAAVWPALQELAAEEPRIRLTRREVNGHIAAASNSALAMAGGEWVAWLDHDDLLAPQALLRVAQVLAARPDAEILYSDEDKVGAQGRTAPYFKPDWNQTLFLGHNLVNHLAVYRAALVHSVGGLRPGFDGAQDYDLALRCIERIEPSQVVHIPEILYHWRLHAGSTAMAAGAKTYAVDAATRALSEHLARTGLAGSVELLPNGHFRTTPFAARAMEGVSILAVGAAAAAQPQRLPPGLAGSGIVEILAVPADRDAINRAVAEARGSHVALLRAGLEALTPDALERLWRFTLRPGVGIAAGSIRDSRGRLRGTGLVLNPQTVAEPLHAGLPADHPGHTGRAVLAQELSAVMLDACVFRRDVFLEVGGLDAAPGFEAAVSLCLRLREQGWKVVWCPPAAWRDGAGDAGAAWGRSGDDDLVRSMVSRHPGLFRADPAYHRALDARRADFSPRLAGPEPWSPEAPGSPRGSATATAPAADAPDGSDGR